MIQSISIQGFKSLQNLENLELGQVNVFVGSNGSGKSNLLEAVGFLSSVASGFVNTNSPLHQGMRMSNRIIHSSKSSNGGGNGQIMEPVPIAVKASSAPNVEYKAKLAPHSLETELPWSYLAEEYSDGDKFHVLRTQSKIDGSIPLLDFLNVPDGVGLGMVRDILLSSSPNIHQLIDTIDEYLIYSPLTPVLRGLIPDAYQSEPVGLLGGRLPDALDDILDEEDAFLGKLPLEEVLDLLDWVAGLDIVPPNEKLLSSQVPALRTVVRFRDRFMAEGRNQLTGYDASEGALYVLFLLALALHPRVPNFFAVDNFDQCLNPRLARAVTRIFVREILASDPPRQVLLTTHSPQVLDGLDLTDDRVRLFAVERDSQGATQARRIRVSEEYLERHQNGQALSTLWVSGAIGGVPDL